MSPLSPMHQLSLAASLPTLVARVSHVSAVSAVSHVSHAFCCLMSLIMSPASYVSVSSHVSAVSHFCHVSQCPPRLSCPSRVFSAPLGAAVCYSTSSWRRDACCLRSGRSARAPGTLPDSRTRRHGSFLRHSKRSQADCVNEAPANRRQTRHGGLVLSIGGEFHCK